MTADESYADVSGSAALLPVPAASVAVFRDRFPDVDPRAMDDAETMDLIEAVAGPVVAAELRYWASQVGGYEGRRMSDRADELDRSEQ